MADDDARDDGTCAYDGDRCHAQTLKEEEEEVFQHVSAPLHRVPPSFGDIHRAEYSELHRLSYADIIGKSRPPWLGNIEILHP